MSEDTPSVYKNNGMTPPRFNRHDGRGSLLCLHPFFLRCSRCFPAGRAGQSRRDRYDCIHNSRRTTLFGMHGDRANELEEESRRFAAAGYRALLGESATARVGRRAHALPSGRPWDCVSECSFSGSIQSRRPVSCHATGKGCCQDPRDHAWLQESLR